MKKIVNLILLFCCLSAEAQVRHFLDTVKYDLTKKRKFYLGLDGKNNIVSDLSLKMFGLQGGYIYNNRTSFYTGLYFTTKEGTSIVENPTAKSDKPDSNTVYVSYGMAYLNFGCEYIFCNTKKWKLSVPAAIGIGSGSYKRYSMNKFYNSSYPAILPFETGINASYKLTWWLWLGAGLGTRISLNGSNDYNGPFYSFGLQIKTGTMVKKIKQAAFKNKQKKK